MVQKKYVHQLSRKLLRGCRFPTLLRLTRVALVLAVLYVVANECMKYFTASSWTKWPPVQKVQPKPKCSMPVLLLDDPEIRHFFHSVPSLNCGSGQNWVYIKDGDTFMIDPAAIKQHGSINCSLQHFWRVSDHAIDSKRYAPFNSGQKLPGDFVAVECEASDGATYKNVHAGVVVSGQAVATAKAAVVPPDAVGVNILIIGFDSISRMTFMRKMKNTYRFLTSELQAVVLEGYNIVGDGTPQALIPILTGSTEVELPLTRKRYPNANYVNVYPWIWNDFKNIGYATFYGEDSPNVGTFTYRLKGFNEQPTDHYQRTFYLMQEKMHYESAALCIGRQPHHKVHFQYLNDFVTTYLKNENMKGFAFSFHSVLSHDNINQVEVADNDMVDFLESLRDNGYLKNTILMMMSDHGHRFASLRATEQGKIEERLPFFSIYLPPEFKSKHPKAAENLRLNAQRLTTPFDIHATLRHTLQYTEPTLGNMSRRGISLFDEVPVERTCTEAAIEPHWCACSMWSPVNVDDPMVQLAAQAVVDMINKYTEKERKLCAKLTLAKIVRASKSTVQDEVMKYKKAKDLDGFVPDLSDTFKAKREYFQVNLITEPGNAHYEASVAVKSDMKVTVNLDAVSHINAYKDLPHCIIDRDYFMAKWCVCYDKVA